MSGIPWSLGKNMYSLADWQVVAGGCWLSPDEHKQCPPHTNFLVITCQVKSSRYLGIHLNYPLSWNDHTGNLSFPLQQRLYFFLFFTQAESLGVHTTTHEVWDVVVMAAYVYGQNLSRCIWFSPFLSSLYSDRHRGFCQTCWISSILSRSSCRQMMKSPKYKLKCFKN